MTSAVHETGHFHGQPHLTPSLIHETGHFHGQPHQKLNFVHETGHFHGQDVKTQQIDSTHSNPMVPKRCGENVGKENRKTLAEVTLRGFLVPGAEARSMRCCHPILQERPLPAICTKMSRTLIWSVPLPATKRAAKPSTATA